MSEGYEAGPVGVDVTASNDITDRDARLLGRAKILNPSGTPIGDATNPVRNDPTGTTTQPVSGMVTANAGTGTMQVDVTDEAARDLGKVDVASLDQYVPIDVDSGAGTLNAVPITWRKNSALGVEFGTSTDPVRTDPTGTTIQPVSGTVSANLNAGINNVGKIDARLRNVADTAYIAPKVNENPIVGANANIDLSTTGIKTTVIGVASKDRIIRYISVIHSRDTTPSANVAIFYSQDGGTTKRAIDRKTFSVTDFKIQQIPTYVVLEDANDQITVEVITAGASGEDADVVIFAHEEDTTN